ncbi:MAG: pyridoxamine 5'-phosphate oxidase family protein [Acidimicrobiales bacterium]
MATMDDVVGMAGTEQGLCVVATVRPDGSVHASVVNAGPIAHPETGEETLAFVARGTARKVALLRSAGRASITYRRGWKWAGIEGRADIVGPDDVEAGEMARLLRSIFVGAGGTHDDWDEFDRVMEAEGRVAVFVRAERVLGNN